MKISTKIKKVRELKGYSQEYMADQMGITQAAYSKIENNEKNINFEKLTTIAKVLDIEPLKLLNFDEQQVFNNCKNGNFGNNGIYNAYSEKERQLYEERIKHLEKEVEFLRTLVK
ncbi:MAG: helix-turn-helix transcriptional regulator [Bacteroidales bacterium]|nr:helix-turn-helix transcriptional regulator [Bacteroidales bacterium]